uniref:NADH dehydrogenase subunit 6 n=1 Tax=Dreissena polymorpha TaxID=45954 RepID=A0A1P8NLW6_DREPO|nr:NADH dehydrogenase subunit 6 [Dreissena polymorpha]
MVTFTLYSVLCTLLVMVIYTSLTATAVITAISTMLMMFLLCSLFLVLSGPSFASFILYISAIAGISVLLSYCLTMMPKISTNTSVQSYLSSNKLTMLFKDLNSSLVDDSSTPPKNMFVKVLMMVMIFCPWVIALLYFSPESENMFPLSPQHIVFALKPNFPPMTETALSNYFWAFTSTFLSIVLFILMISSLKMISSLLGAMGPNVSSKK